MWCGFSLSLTYQLASAQTFDPVQIGSNLDTEIQSGSVSDAQFSSLQQAEINAFLETEKAQNYFNQSFAPDGVYGELKNGAIVDDWETLAKAMGATAAVLTGAYSVWRQRRKEEIEGIASGDNQALLDLFEREFGDDLEKAENQATQAPFLLSESQIEGRLLNSELWRTKIPQTTEAWELWALNRGLAGGAGTLALMFGLWRRKRSQTIRDERNFQREVRDRPNFEMMKSHLDALPSEEAAYEKSLSSFLAPYREIVFGSREANLAYWSKPFRSAWAENYLETQMEIEGLQKQLQGELNPAQKRAVENQEKRITHFEARKPKLIEQRAYALALLAKNLENKKSAEEKGQTARALGIASIIKKRRDSIARMDFQLRTNIPKQIENAKARIEELRSRSTLSSARSLNLNRRLSKLQEQASIYKPFEEDYQNRLAIYEKRSTDINDRYEANWAHNLKTLKPKFNESWKRLLSTREPIGGIAWENALGKLASETKASIEKRNEAKSAGFNQLWDKSISTIGFETIAKWAQDGVNQEYDPAYDKSIEALRQYYDEKLANLPVKLKQDYAHKRQHAERYNSQLSHTAWREAAAKFDQYYGQWYSCYVDEQKRLYVYNRVQTGIIRLPDEQTYVNEQTAWLSAYYERQKLEYPDKKTRYDLARLFSVATTNSSFLENMSAEEKLEFSDLEPQIGSANRVMSFVNTLESAATKSNFFSGLKVGLDFKSYTQKKFDILESQDPYKSKIQAIEARINTSNILTAREYIARQTPTVQAHLVSRGVNKLTNDMLRDRRRMAINQNYSSQKLAEHAHAIASSRTGYSASYEQTLRRLAEDATTREATRLGGWERLYKVHPDIHAEQMRVLNAEKSILKKQQAQWDAAKQTALTLLAGIKNPDTNWFEAFKWLNQEKNERLANPLTQEILHSETGQSGASLLGSELSIAEALKPLAQLEHQHEEEQLENQQSARSLQEIHSAGFHGSVDKILAQMKYFASPEGMAKTDAINNQASLNARRGEFENLTEGWTDEQLKKYTFKDYLAGHKDQTRGLNSTQSSSLSNHQSTQTTETQNSGQSQPTSQSQVNENGEIDTRNTVELLEPYGDLSSEAPASVEAFKNYLAQQKSLNESSENPVNFEQFKQFLADKEAKEKALTDQILDEVLNLGNADAEASLAEAKNNLKDVQDQTFDEYIEEQLAQAKRDQISAFFSATEKVESNPIVRDAFDSANKVSVVEVQGKRVTFTLNIPESQINQSSWWTYYKNRFVSYIRDASDNVAFGEYSQKDQNLLGTLLEIGTALSGLDAPMDLRDLVKSLQDKDLAKTAIYSVALLPLVGALKTFLRNTPETTLKGKLTDLTNTLKQNFEQNFRVNLNQNGEFVTPEGFRVKVENAPVQKSLGSGASSAAWMVDSPNFKNGLYETVKGLDHQVGGEVLNLTNKNGLIKILKPGVTHPQKFTQSSVDYVVFSDGSVKFGHLHSFLSDSNPVRYAGQAHFSSGKLTGFDNMSGHYKPNKNDIEGINFTKISLNNRLGQEANFIKN